MRKRIAVVMFLLIIFAVSCKSPTSPDGVLLIKITGVVSNKETGASIENALVYVNRFITTAGYEQTVAETRTDKNGQFYLTYEVVDEPDCSARYDWFNIAADGYYWRDRLFGDTSRYFIKCTAEEQIFDAQLDPNSTPFWI